MSTKVRKWVSILMSVLLLLEMMPAFAATATCPKCGSADYESGFDEWWQEATCTEPGKVQHSHCFDCEYHEFEYPPALGHDWDNWKTRSEPTCTAEGMEVRFCKRCKASETHNIPALGHDWSGWKNDAAPTTVSGGAGATCTTGGSQYRYCERCEIAETRNTAPLGHDWGDWQVEYEGTCIKQGMNYHRCKRCKETEYRYSGYGDHSWGEWHVVKYPTPKEKGYEERVCSICSKTEQRELEMLIEPTGAMQLQLISVPASFTGSAGDEIEIVYLLTNTGNTTLNINASRSVDGNGDLAPIIRYANQPEMTYSTEPFSAPIFKPGDSHEITIVTTVTQEEIDAGQIVRSYMRGAVIWLGENGIPMGWEGAQAPYDCDFDGTKINTAEVITTIPVTRPDYTSSLLLELVSAPASFSGKEWDTFQLVYRLTNTGDTTLGMNGEQFTYSDYTDPGMHIDRVVQPDMLNNEIAPGMSHEFILTVPVSAADIAAGQIVRLYSVLAVVWIGQNGIPMGWDNAQTPYRMDFDNQVYSNEVSVTIPFVEPPPMPVIEKTLVNTPANGVVFVPGETAVFTITVRNDTDSTLSDFELYDVLDSALGIKTTTLETQGVIGPGAERKFVYTHQITQEDAERTYVKNKAVYQVRLPDGTAAGVESDNVHVDCRVPNTDPANGLIWLQKSVANLPANGAYYAAGETITYLLEGRNDSERVLYDVSITDALNGSSGVLAMQNTLEHGQKITATFDYTVSPEDVARGYVENTAGMVWYYVSDDRVNHINSNTVTVPTDGTIVDGGILTVEKKLASTPANGMYFTPSETALFIITVRNESDRTLYNLDLIDRETVLGQFHENHMADYAELPSGAEMVFNYPYTVTWNDGEFGYMLNLAYVEYQENNEHFYAFSDEIFVPCSQEAYEQKIREEIEDQITLTKTVTSTPANGQYYVLGETITYEITVRNDGDVGVGLCVVDDTLLNPMNNYFYSVVELDSFIQLIAGEQRTYTFSHVVDETNVADGTVKNRAEMTYMYDDQEYTAVSNFVESPVGSSVLSSGVTLTTRALNAPANGLYYVAGEVIHFEVTLLSAPEQMVDVVVTDTICPDLLANEPTMTFSEPISWTFDYTVTDFVAAYGTLSSVATIDANDINGNDLYATALLALPTGFEGGFGVITEMTIEKTETSTPLNGIYYTKGETITYDIMIRNDGETPFGECIIYDSMASADIGSAEHLYPGEERHVSFSHTVTAADVAAGCVYNTALVEYNSGSLTETKMSNTVVSDTDGIPDAPYTPAHPGTITPPKAAGVDTPCSRELVKKGDNGEETLTHYCGEHIDTRKAVLELVSNATGKDALLSAWAQAQVLWRAEIDEMYETLMISADATTKISVMDERIRFYTSVGCHEALLRTVHPDDPAFVAEKIAEMLMNKSVEMCYELNTAPESRVDAFAHVSGFELSLPSGNECTWSMTALDNGDVEATLHLCEHHASVLQIRNRLLSGDNTDAAWLTARQLWKIEVSIGYNALFAALDPAKQAAVLADHKAFESAIAAREKVLLALYGNPAVVNEILARDMMERAAEICSIK